MLIVGLIAAGGACQKSPEKELAALRKSDIAKSREARLKEALGDRETVGDPSAPLARWVLPKALKEISGLALTPDGRLFVHGDEQAEVWELDYRLGVMVKKFSLGETVVRGDFEAITMANNVLWLMTSNGTLYEFREGDNKAKVKFQKHNTGLKKECEFEGMVYDPSTDVMVLACKNIFERKDRASIVLYKWKLRDDGGPRVTRMVIPVTEARGPNDWKALQVSDITLDPATGNYVLIASKERALVMLTTAGEPVYARSLPENHDQPEGVAVTKDNLLLVSDEAAKGPAVLTVYRWP